MNKLGIVLLWIAVVIVLFAAIPLTTMALDVRSKWLAEVNKRQEDIEKSTKELREAKTRVRRLDEQLNQQLQVWGDAWKAPNSKVQPGGAGIVEVTAGESVGLGLKAKQAGATPPPVYVFADNNGVKQYLGEFKIEQGRADRSALKLSRTPFPGEITTWPNQPGEWTVLESIPSDWRATIGDLEGEIQIAATTLRSQLLTLDILNKQIEESQASLDQRNAELLGDGDAPDGASQEVLDGLVQTLRKYETQRDTLLADVDVIRHELDASYVKLQEVIAANRAKVKELENLSQVPSMSSATSASAAGAE